jgi:uncharacterized protein
LKRFLFLIILLIFSSVSLYSQRSKAVAPENKIKNYLTDKTGTLTSSQIADLEAKLSSFDKQTSTQVVVYMMSSLEGDALEEKSIEIAEQNGVGKKSKNNGVLLFIVKDDRKLRIEVGYGLEGALPDATCDQIIRKEITPMFKQGKYYEGINAGVDAIIGATKGEYKQDTKNTNNGSGWGGLICGLPMLFAIFIFVVVFILIVRVFSRFGGGRGSGPWYTGGSSGWSSGSSGSSWGGGGGFSGGGGSFGGGGASGSW